MLSINTNLSSLIAQQSLSSSTTKLNQAIERMSTGFKINHAKDNAANYSISTNLTTKISSYMVAEDNVAMGLDMLSTANGSLDQISDKLTRLRALATQAGNGTYGGQSLSAINSEANALVDEIQRLYTTAEYNGIKLFGSEGVNGGQQAEPAAYTMARSGATSTNTTYSDEEIAEMLASGDIVVLDDSVTTFDCDKYLITDVSGLERLAELVNDGDYNTGYGSEFILGADIDLEGVEWTPIGNDRIYFQGTFDGNGHIISNLKIDTTEDYQGLFSITSGIKIKNIGLENVDIKGGNYTGGLIGYADGGVIENCYVTGSVEATGGGLLCGEAYYVDIVNNFAKGNVTATEYAGGLVGYWSNDGDEGCARNNFFEGKVSATEGSGGFSGSFVDWCYGSLVDKNIIIAEVEEGVMNSGNVFGYRDCSNPFGENYSTVSDPNSIQMSEDEILAPANLEAIGFTADNGWTIVDGQPVLAYSMAARNANNNGGGLSGSSYVTLQVGVNADSYSQIGLEFGFSLDGLDALREIGNDTTTDFLTQLDTMLATVSAKQTEYGAAQNRLESALDEISTAYENLVSSRSTIRDADIAEESSAYIRQQILQQASATLLATANQSPSIALQLI